METVSGFLGRARGPQASNLQEWETLKTQPLGLHLASNQTKLVYRFRLLTFAVTPANEGDVLPESHTVLCSKKSLRPVYQSV